MDELYQKAADILAEAKHVVGFSGAGISAESGIPTFRDPGGIWDQFDMAEVGTSAGLLETAQKKPGMIRKFMLDTAAIFEAAAPNQGHVGLSELEELGLLKSVITQNIDNLHQEAGNTNVIEIHGNLYRARCLSCGRREQLKKDTLISKVKEILADEQDFSLSELINLFPACTCGSMSRPDVVMFGEAVQGLPDAYSEASQCDVMLVLGTTGLIYPAAALPYEAHKQGARVIEINPTGNYFSGISEVFIREKTGKAMPRLVGLVRERLNQ
jgi:NAD-dependent deacetylase